MNITWFKRGAKVSAIHDGRSHASDEERGSVENPSSLNEKSSGHNGGEQNRMVVEAGGAPAMTDVFSWQHLEYTVTMPDGTQRRLLDDISGFVAPGKLTALMGESGAGKVGFPLGKARMPGR